MTYRLDGTDDYVQFSIAPLSGYTAGAFTIALFFNRADSFTRQILYLTDSGGGRVLGLATNGADPRLELNAGGTVVDVSQSITTSTWWLLAATYAGSGATPRFHRHNGTSWAHTNGTSSGADSPALGGTDLIRLGTRNQVTFLGCDIACIGFKKSDSSDAAVENLSRTSFQAWRDFGFDWLIGFDSSLETAGVLQDQASPGTGDETAITGTSAVSDPPSWAWTPPALSPVADFSATPLTGLAPLEVTFTDESTNTPTSWAWDFGDGDTDTVQDPTHVFAAGTYTVELTATNATGSDTETKAAYVVVDAEGGGPPTARFQVAFGDVTLDPSPTWTDMD